MEQGRQKVNKVNINGVIYPSYRIAAEKLKVPCNFISVNVRKLNKSSFTELEVDARIVLKLVFKKIKG